MTAPLDRDLIERARAIDILSVAPRYGARRARAAAANSSGRARSPAAAIALASSSQGHLELSRLRQGRRVIALVQHFAGTTSPKPSSY